MKWKSRLKSSLKLKLFSIILFLLFLTGSLIKEPWHDELYTQEVVKKPFLEILNEIKKDNYPPLYYFLIHILTIPFKYSIFSIRFFSGIFILLSGLVINKIIKNINQKDSTLSFLVLLFPVPLYFASEARCYSLIIFLSSLFFYEILLKKNQVLIFIYLTLLSYTHYISIFYFSYLLYFIIFKREKKYILSSLLSILSILPLYFLFITQPKESILWTDKFFNFKSFFIFFSNLGPNLFQNYVYNFSPLVPAFIFILLNIFAIFSNLKTKYLNIIIYPFLFNILTIFIFSYTYKNIYTPSRTESFFFLPFALFLIIFLSAKSKYIKYIKILYSITALLSLFFILFAYLKGIPINREMEKIASLVKSDTKICVIGYWKLTLSYQLQKKGLYNEIKTFPPSQDEHQGWYHLEKLEDDDLNWFAQNVILSNFPYLVLWDKNNPCGRKIIPLFPSDIKIFSTENFNFIIKN